MGDKIKCRLCQKCFNNEDMSDEHYPAKTVGNNDLVMIDPEKFIESLIKIKKEANEYYEENNKEKYLKEAEKMFDEKIAMPLYPNGRTNRTLCVKCNNFLGRYDEAYKKFYNIDGSPQKLKGFTDGTKYMIIKSIYGKFLSLPETQDVEFDFLDFILDEKQTEYKGKWNLYFIHRNEKADFLKLKDYEAGKLIYPEGTVFVLTDEKFCYYLLNFKKHSTVKTNGIFDILTKNYCLVKDEGDKADYHQQLVLSRLLCL